MYVVAAASETVLTAGTVELIETAKAIE